MTNVERYDFKDLLSEINIDNVDYDTKIQDKGLNAYKKISILEKQKNNLLNKLEENNKLIKEIDESYKLFTNNLNWKNLNSVNVNWEKFKANLDFHKLSILNLSLIAVLSLITFSSIFMFNFLFNFYLENETLNNMRDVLLSYIISSFIIIYFLQKTPMWNKKFFREFVEFKYKKNNMYGLVKDFLYDKNKENEGNQNSLENKVLAYELNKEETLSVPIFDMKKDEIQIFESKILKSVEETKKEYVKKQNENDKIKEEIVEVDKNLNDLYKKLGETLD